MNSLMSRSPKTLFGETLFDNFIDNFFDGQHRQLQPIRRSAPATNVKSSEAGYELEVALPGLSRSDIDLKVDRNLLTISSAFEASDSVKEDIYSKREFNYSSFTRSWVLPKNVNSETISARYDAGVLTVTIPTIEDRSSNRVIEIE